LSCGRSLAWQYHLGYGSLFEIEKVTVHVKEQLEGRLAFFVMNLVLEEALQSSHKLAQPKRYTNLINLMTNLDLKTKI
jgi:hypothetical protein